MDSTPNGAEPRMDPTPNGLNPKGLNPEGTQPRMDSIPNGLNPEWTELSMLFVTCLAEGGGIDDVPLDVLSEYEDSIYSYV